MRACLACPFFLEGRRPLLLHLNIPGRKSGTHTDLTSYHTCVPIGREDQHRATCPRARFKRVAGSLRVMLGPATSRILDGHGLDVDELLDTEAAKLSTISRFLDAAKR